MASNLSERNREAGAEDVALEIIQIERALDLAGAACNLAPPCACDKSVLADFCVERGADEDRMSLTVTEEQPAGGMFITRFRA